MKSYKEFMEGFVHPNHKKLDANNNGKLDANDFKLLRKKKQSTKEDCSMKEEVELDEKLDPSMGAGEYIKDFKESDAPQFKGKSPEKRRIMGVAACLAAKREKNK